MRKKANSRLASIPAGGFSPRHAKQTAPFPSMMTRNTVAPLIFTLRAGRLTT